MCRCLRGVSRWFTPLACGPGSPELSESYMDMASKLITFTFTLKKILYMYNSHSRLWTSTQWTRAHGLTTQVLMTLKWAAYT